LYGYFKLFRIYTAVPCNVENQIVNSALGLLEVKLFRLYSAITLKLIRNFIWIIFCCNMLSWTVYFALFNFVTSFSQVFFYHLFASHLLKQDIIYTLTLFAAFLNLKVRVFEERKTSC